MLGHLRLASFDALPQECHDLAIEGSIIFPRCLVHLLMQIARKAEPSFLPIGLRLICCHGFSF